MSYYGEHGVIIPETAGLINTYPKELLPRTGEIYMVDIAPAEQHDPKMFPAEPLTPQEAERIIINNYDFSPLLRAAIFGASLELPIQEGDQDRFERKGYRADSRSGMVYLDPADIEELLSEYPDRMLKSVAVQQGFRPNQIQGLWRGGRSVLRGSSIKALDSQQIRRLLREKPIDRAVFVGPEDMDSEGRIIHIQAGFTWQGADTSPLKLSTVASLLERVNEVPHQRPSIARNLTLFPPNNLLEHYLAVPTPTGISIDLTRRMPQPIAA